MNINHDQIKWKCKSNAFVDLYKAMSTCRLALIAGLAHAMATVVYFAVSIKVLRARINKRRQWFKKTAKQKCYLMYSNIDQQLPANTLH